MDVALKQRLVGASVIIALAVIFIPMIFDDSKMAQNQSIPIKIPDVPEGLKHRVLAIDRDKAMQNSNDDISKIENDSADNAEETADKHIAVVDDNPIITKQETIVDIVDNSISNDTIESNSAQNPVDKPTIKEVIDKPKKEQTKPEIKNETAITLESMSYRVSLGAFSQQKNAQQLKAKIINGGYVAIVEKDQVKNLYKVYSKQLNSLTEAKILRTKIEKLKLNIGQPGIETLNKQDQNAVELMLDTGWIIQMGSFSSKTNSIKLRNKIRNKGFVSFVDEIENTKKQKLYRVRVGPYATREEALAEEKNIKTKMSLKGIIKPHEKQKVVSQ